MIHFYSAINYRRIWHVLSLGVDLHVRQVNNYYPYFVEGRSRDSKRLVTYPKSKD